MAENMTQTLIEWVESRKKNRDENRLQPGDLLMDEGHLDSLNMMSLIAYVEDLLGHEISDELMSFSNFSSVKKINDVFFAENKS